MFVKCRVFREFNLHIRTVNATFFCGGRKAGYLAREILCRASVSFRSESVTSVFGREWGGGRRERGGGGGNRSIHFVEGLLQRSPFPL